MKKLYRSRKDKVVFGVCGGFGHTYDIDPTTVRIMTIFLCLATGILPLLITYCIARIVIPKRQTK